MTRYMFYEHAMETFWYEIALHFPCNSRPADYIKSIGRNPAAT